MAPRRFPAPWVVTEHAECFTVEDANGQRLGTFYFRHNPVVALQAKSLERDEARRLAANFAKLPELLKKPC